MIYIGFILICLVLAYFTFAVVVGGYALTALGCNSKSEGWFFFAAFLFICWLWYLTFTNAPFTVTIAP